MKNYADKPWLKSYKLGPYKLKTTLGPYPIAPVTKVLDDSAAKFPNKTSVLFQGRVLKYRELRDRANSLASALAGLGIKKSDCVNVLLPNSFESIISPWGIQKAGAILVATSTLRTDEGLLHEAGNSDSRAIICNEAELERVISIREKCNIEHIIVTSNQGYDVERITKTLPKGVHEFGKLLENHDPVASKVEINPMEDLCELPHTGGTTGLPKAVMVTHYNRYANILQVLPWSMAPLSPGIIGKASILIPLSLFHAFGHAIHQAAINWGLRIILMPDPRDMDMMVKLIKEYRPFLIACVPTQLMQLVKAKIGKLNSLALSGSAPLPDEVRKAMKKEMGNPVGEGYGMTECGPVTHFDLSGFGSMTGFMGKEKKSIGVPVPDTECKIIDPVTGQEVPFGKNGEIVLKGPQTMKGYWPKAGNGLTEDGWLHTGDIGYMDQDGYFFLTDRIKDMVNISGMKVYTTTVDEVIFQHPGVLMAAAFGVPDVKKPGSERVKAVIRLKDDYKGKVSQEDIIKFCKERLAPYAVPKFIEFKDELPVTATEKLSKKELRDEALAQMKARGELD